MSTQQSMKSTRWLDRTAIATSVVISTVMLGSLWLFLDQPNHRIGDVAWNALFQCFGPPLILCYAGLMMAFTLSGKVGQASGIVAAILPLIVSGYCVVRVMPIIFSA